MAKRKRKPATKRAPKPKPRNAANEVFDIAELLDLVLLQASPIDLYVLQRINKSWRSAIHSSQKLQSKMLEAAPADLQEGLSRLLDGDDVYISTLYSMPRLTNLGMRGSPRYPGSTAIADFKPPRGTIFGWQGKTKVHTSGAWERIALGTAGGFHIRVMKKGGWPSDVTGDVKEGATLWEFFEVLKECFEVRLEVSVPHRYDSDTSEDEMPPGDAMPWEYDMPSEIEMPEDVGSEDLMPSEVLLETSVPPSPWYDDDMSEDEWLEVEMPSLGEMPSGDKMPPY